MLSDEEKRAIKIMKEVKDKNVHTFVDELSIILNLIEKQQKEIKELTDKYTEKICKGVEEEILEEYRREIEELKDDRKKYAEEYIHNNPWLYKQLNENYILRVESEQKERKAWIKGTNDAHELCNKKWKDKIKAEIEESELLIDNSQGCMSNEDLYKEYGKIEFGKSLLEKE